MSELKDLLDTPMDEMCDHKWYAKALGAECPFCENAILQGTLKELLRIIERYNCAEFAAEGAKWESEGGKSKGVPYEVDVQVIQVAKLLVYETCGETQ